jgi:multidrug efflux pump subunit AcrB
MLVRIKQGKDRLEAAAEVVKQNKWPLFGATGIAILAFSSIGLSQDATGEFCRSLFIVILYSLLISWLVALTLTPLLCYWFLPGPKALEDESPDSSDPYDTKLYRWYKSVLITAVSHRYKVILGSVATLFIALYSFGFVAQSFFPKSSMPYFMVHYWLPEGTDIRTTEDDIEQISDFLTAQPEIKSATGFIGEGAPRFILVYAPELTNSSYGMMLVHVNDYRDIDKLLPRVETYLAENYPNAEPKLQKFSVGPSPQSSVEVRISGRDPKELRRLSQAVQNIIREQGGQAIRDNWRQRIKTIEPQFSERQASFSGVTRSDVNQALALNSTGTNVGLYREGNDLIPIYARLANAEDDDISDLVNIQVWSGLAQSYVPILQVVDNFKTTWSDARVQRWDRKPTITVGAEPKEGVLAGELIARIKGPIEALELPIGYELEWGGELESSSDAQGSLVNGIIISLSVMVIISILLFNSLRQPFIIWAVVPFAIIGVTAGLLITGLPFGFMSLLGFLSLMGMLIKNVIVLLEQAVIDERDGMGKYDAIIHAAVSRARPVIMAAGTTVLGMIPLLTDAFFSSMAVTIMAGLAIASLATLVLVPALFAAVYNVKSTA